MNLSGTSVEMKKKYQELIEVPNAVIFDLGLEKNYISLNPEWTRLTGYTVKETLGTSFFTYIDKIDHPLLNTQFAVLLDGKEEGIHKEIRLTAKQGTTEKAHLFLRINRKQSGEAESFSGTLNCLSSREENIDSYRKDVRNYQMISENMTDMVSVMAQDGLVLYASPSHTTTLGLELDKYIGSYPIKYIHPGDQERMFHFFHKMVKTWSALEIEYRCQHRDGHWLNLEMKCTPIKGPNGEIQVISVSRDITLRKKAEEELRQATMKFKTLISSLPYGVKVENNEGEVTLCNDAYFEIVLQNKLASEPQKDEASQVLEDDAIYVQRMKEITRKRQLLRAEEIHLKNSRIIERDAIPMMDGDHFDGYMWIYRDITDKKKAEAKLQKANQVLKEMSMLDSLTGIANRRCFDFTLEKEWKKRAGRNEPISLLILDIDFFKVFNDFYGHQAGDKCLMQIGRILSDLPKGPNDLAARYGGEEFVVLLPGNSKDQAVQIAQSIQTAVRKGYISHKGSFVNECLTISIGISTKTAMPGIHPYDLIAEADQALYKAKRNGRNQYSVSP